VHLSASGSNCSNCTFKWYTCASGGNPISPNPGSSYSPNLNQTTSYWVSCTINGCESDRTKVTGTIKDCHTYCNGKMMQQGGDDNEMSDGTFVIYPNPNDGIFFIETGNSSFEKTKVVITDLSGKMVNAETSINGAKMQVRLNSVAKGVYFINISDETGTYRSKILIQ
jgi:Secretion system C-terminal sorting domain/Ig-like domain CHU_C associated